MSREMLLFSGLKSSFYRILSAKSQVTFKMSSSVSNKAAKGSSAVVDVRCSKLPLR